LKAEKENPATYTIESENITLNNPADGTKLGYVFAGWTGSNGSTAEKSVTIAKGSTGNKEYVANYEPAEYKYTVQYYYDNVIDESKTETKTAKIFRKSKFFR